MELLTLDQINAAADRLRPVMRLTPVIASRVLSDRTGEQVWLNIPNLVQDLQPDGGLAGDDVGVVERVDQHRAAGPGDRSAGPTRYDFPRHVQG